MPRANSVTMERAAEVTEELIAAFRRLIPQLSSLALPPTGPAAEVSGQALRLAPPGPPCTIPIDCFAAVR